MHTETETAPGGGDKRVPQRGETAEGDSCPQRPGPHRIPRAAPSSVGRLPKYNTNNSGREPGLPIREPPGPRAPGPRQLSSLGHGGDRGCGEAAVAPGCLPQIPQCKSSSHVPTSERGFFLQSAQFWRWATQRLSTTGESDLGSASSGQMRPVPADRWCPSGQVRPFIVLINPRGTLKTRY